ncbi:MAG: response regulator [Polyangiales bacterium]
MQAAPPEELDRLDALASCRIVGTSPESDFDALVKPAALLTDSSHAALTLIDADRLWVKAAYGCTPGEYPRAGAPCELVLRESGFFELTELDHAHPLAAGARSYAAVPLRDGRRVLGTLAVYGRTARMLSGSQREHLMTLGQQASALLELRKLRDQHLLKNEALLYSATRISGIGCWQWDLRTGKTTLTDEVFALFGVDPSEPLGWEEYIAHVHPEDRDGVVARIGMACRGEATQFPDYRIVRANGEVRTVHATSELLRDDEGRPMLLTGALQDVTALRAAEEQRKQVAVKAVQSQKLESLGVLSGGVAHDFNNLLVGVLGNAELALADRSLAPTSRDLLERIVEAAQRAGGLTRQLLAYTGRSHLKLVEVDLASQIERLVARVQDTLPRGVSLRSSLERGLAGIRADLDQLQLLTSNLILNAAESYEGEGEVTLRVFSLEVEAEPAHDVSVPTRLGAGRYVVLEVGDRGCGMVRSTLDRALEPFFSTKFTGRGLGLSAVLGIARSHSGVLTVDSTPGEGSRVRMHFPALDRLAAPRPQSEPPLRAGGLGGHTVLLVDDEALVRNVERMAMQRAGLTVLEAADGTQAIEVLRQNRELVDLVVLDLVMPGLDAASTLTALRAIRPDVPVIVQSGYSEEEASRSLEQLDGPIDFLSKPFSVATMLGKVTSALRRK